MAEFRLQRVQHVLRNEISAMIMTEEIKDPHVSSFVSITAVEVAKDLSHAKIFVSSFQGARKLQQSVDALNHAAGFIQSRLNRKLHLRTTPRLTFVPDSSIERAIDLTRKIEELKS